MDRWIQKIRSNFKLLKLGICALVINGAVPRVIQITQAADADTKTQLHSGKAIRLPNSAISATVIFMPPIYYLERRTNNLSDRDLISRGCKYTTSNKMRIRSLIHILKKNKIMTSNTNYRLVKEFPSSAIFLDLSSGNELKFFFTPNSGEQNFVRGHYVSKSPYMPPLMQKI